jgi:KDO2-lipid IV(A) lauroyltransferase
MSARLSVLFFWLLHFLPFPLLVAGGNLLGKLLFTVAGERRDVALINLRLCFPEMTEAARENIVKQHFQMFTRSILERGILWWSTPARIESLIKVKGWKYYEELKNGPVIFLVPHFVGLDVAATWTTLHLNGVSMYSMQKNRYFSDLLVAKRSRFGDQLLYSRQDGLRPIIKAIKTGRPFFYLPDQDQDIRDAEFIPFFGVPAATLTALTRLATVTKARIIPLTVKMLPGSAGYELQYYPAWENYPTADVTADTRRMNEFIEQRVLEMPAQYFWVHKRFKTRPVGEESFYE